MKPLRILHTESSLELGGQEFRVLSEAAGMKQRGHGVWLAVQPGSQIGEQARRLGIGIEELPMSLSRFPILIVKFLRLINHHGIDVVQTHGSVDSWTASLAGRLAPRRPLVIRSRHKSTPVSDTRRHRWLYGKLPHAVVTTGEAVKRELRDKSFLPDARIVSIPTGVDMSQFTPRHINLEQGESKESADDELVVGTVAFFRDYKGLDYFLKAAQLVSFKIPMVKFLLVGQGPDQRRLQQQIIDLGLDRCATIIGFRSDIPQILETFDVFVMPSVSGEGVPQALTQALAMERAVVATNIGGIPEVVTDGENGFLVEPRDVTGLAEKICMLLQAPDLRRRLGKAGRLCVLERYSLDGMLDATEQLYECLLHERETQTPSQG